MAAEDLKRMLDELFGSNGKNVEVNIIHEKKADECATDTLIATNARLSRTVEKLSEEHSRIMNMLHSIMKENDSLRRCLGK